MSNLFDFRREYTYGNLNAEDLPEDPIALFTGWFKDADNYGIHDPTAMVLSTTGHDLKPSSRMVLLKEFDHRGFTFFTNYQSHKARDLEENPNASLLFPWHKLDRQVRVEGTVQKISPEESDEYFSSRPEGSKLSAWASPQSTVIRDRDLLDDRQKDHAEKFRNSAIPRPDFWGGYRLFPVVIEFWQGRENRLHDRIEYFLQEQKWNKRRLAP